MISIRCVEYERGPSIEKHCSDVCVVCQGSVLQCSADVLFPRTEKHSPPEVQLRSENLQQLSSSSEEEEAFYQKYISPDSAISVHDIPGVTNTNSGNKPTSHETKPLLLCLQTATVTSVKTWSRFGIWLVWRRRSSCWESPVRTRSITWHRWPTSPSRSVQTIYSSTHLQQRSGHTEHVSHHLYIYRLLLGHLFGRRILSVYI